MDKNDKAPFNAYGSNVFTIGDLYKWFPDRTLTYSAAYGYLVNKPLPAAGISADNVRG